MTGKEYAARLLLAILVGLILAACASIPAPTPVPRLAAQPSPTTLPPTVAPTGTPPPTSTFTPAPTATPPPDPTPAPVPRLGGPCQDRAVYGERSASAYVLPYPVGDSYLVTQSICSVGSHRNQLAYDFDMPVGADVTAARAGLVMLTGDKTPDIGTPQYRGQANFVYIQHDDGTVAFYAHLKQDSVAVRVGDRVEQGQRIAASGNSGYTGGFPHLHFGVYAWWPPEEGYDVPVNFRNATAFGALLRQGQYPALRY